MYEKGGGGGGGSGVATQYTDWSEPLNKNGVFYLSPRCFLVISMVFFSDNVVPTDQDPMLSFSKNPCPIYPTGWKVVTLFRITGSSSWGWKRVIGEMRDTFMYNHLKIKAICKWNAVVSPDGEPPANVKQGIFSFLGFMTMLFEIPRDISTEELHLSKPMDPLILYARKPLDDTQSH